MARLAEVAGISTETLRGQCHKNQIPGAFIELTFPRSKRARWMIPPDSAAMILAARAQADRIHELDQHVETVVPDPQQRKR